MGITTTTTTALALAAAFLLPSVSLAQSEQQTLSDASSSSSLSSSSTTASCPSPLTPSSYAAPVVAAGYTARLLTTNLTSPRGLLLDPSGALLVVQKGVGIQRLALSPACPSVEASALLVADRSLNHGIEMSADGRTLYASSADKVLAWAYDPDKGTVQAAGEARTLVRNMANSDHVSRTLLLSRKADGVLLVSRGSAENMDAGTRDRSSGRSQIRAFDLKDVPEGGYDYASSGRVLGWGLRNSVGVAEEPVTGRVYSVENSADQIRRLGEDVHEDDPGEELNYHGFLNGSLGGGGGGQEEEGNQGGNFGYPDCFALWGTDVPERGGLEVGSQFALEPDGVLNDTTCREEYVAPRLTFQAHMAPLDIKFNANGTEAYVSFHGSWNRNDPVGYKLSVIPFGADGRPADPPGSTTAARDVLSNADLSACPRGCFRPAGLAVDKQGRVFMSSDSTGDIWVVQKAEVSGGTPAGGGGGTDGGGTETSGGGGSSTGTPNVGVRLGGYGRVGEGVWMAVGAAVLGVMGGLVMVAA